MNKQEDEKVDTLLEFSLRLCSQPSSVAELCDCKTYAGNDSNDDSNA